MIASLFLSVAIVAHEPGYYTSLANHVGRWLKDQDIAAEVVKPAEMRSKLAKEKKTREEVVQTIADMLRQAIPDLD